MLSLDFLVELGTEELPPKAMKPLAEAFLSGVEKGLNDAGLSFTTSRYYAAPRRLALVIEALATQQPDRTKQLDGPPLKAAFDAEGNPTAAALGFARKCGVELDELDQSGPRLRYVQTIAGKPAAELLPAIVDSALAGLPIPKRMRWGAGKTEFVRPTQWLVMLHGDSMIPCEILSQHADRSSLGHRFHHPDPVRINSPESYADDLREAYVIADFAERRELIRQKVEELAAEQQGTAIMPDDLLDEVTALVEWPVPLVCSFEERFLAVPQEALILTMQDNQKYFCLLDADGRLLPRFITVANIESTDPAQIIAGNEKVVRPRLTDAEFFYEQDQKQPLETNNQRLAHVVFQAELGSVYDKAVRVSNLAQFIARQIGADPDRAARAGLLSKCDLASEMVGEFPELQGIAGYYYAKHDGEPEDVALALNEQYMPRGAGAELPSTLTGAAVALADKLDTLVGIFGVGMLPTGSRDPYALRRAALGVLRILIEKRLELDLHKALETAVAQYADKIEHAGLENQVQEFIFDRLRARYEDQGIDVAVYQAVRAVHPDSPLDFDQRIEAVQAFRRLPEAEALAAANKRVANILSKADSGVPGEISQPLLTEEAELTLSAAVIAAEEQVRPLAEKREYRATLESLAALREPVDAFFDEVLVNADDPLVKANRYALLARLRGLFLGVADISLLG